MYHIHRPNDPARPPNRVSPSRRASPAVNATPDKGSAKAALAHRVVTNSRHRVDHNDLDETAQEKMELLWPDCGMETYLPHIEEGSKWAVIGSGVAGIAMVVFPKYAEEALTYLRDLLRKKAAHEVSVPTSDISTEAARNMSAQGIVIKVQMLENFKVSRYNPEPIKNQILAEMKEIRKEWSVHRRCTLAKAVSVPGYARYDLRAHVPALLCAGFPDGSQMAVTVMTPAPGKTLDDIAALERNRSTDKVLSRVRSMQYATLCLWLCAGVYHSDLHSGNVLFDDRDHATIIDFGRSVRLSSAAVSQLRADLEAQRPRSVEQLQTLMEAFESAQLPDIVRQYKVYHPSVSRFWKNSGRASWVAGVFGVAAGSAQPLGIEAVIAEIKKRKRKP